MKLKAMNDSSISVNGTSLKGYITTTRGELNRIFGECEEWEGDKSRYEWTLRFEDDNGDELIATIYDWKNYADDSGTINVIPLDSIFGFNIGGNSERVVEAISQAMTSRGGNFADLKTWR